MIKLEETENEYLVAIPAEQRERAKRIRPRRWDSGRKRWIYPRENQIYDALVAEFAEDAAIVDITRPDSSVFDRPISDSSLEELFPEIFGPVPDIEEENESLKDQMAEIRQSLSLLAQENSDKTEDQFSELQDALAAREQTIEQLQRELTEYRTNFEKVKAQIAEAKSQSEQLEEQLARNQSLQSFSDQLKQSAIDATTGDSKFGSILDRLTIDRSLPNGLTRAMESELRTLLGMNDQVINLYGLLSEAADADLLPKDAIDLAHLIRKQRNIVTHDDVHHKTYRAREILCLFAAALLWPEFPE